MKFGDILLMIVYVALATTIVIHPNSASDINAAGNAFSGSISSAITGTAPKA
jgi:hypothetical protein